MKEEWKDIPGFVHTRYQVSNFGKVRSFRFIKKTNKIKVSELKLSPISESHNIMYYRVGLYQCPGQRKPIRKRVHQLVAEAFLTKPNIDGIQINHKDGNKHNNRVDNLEWVTIRENNIHAIKTGLQWFHRGETHPQSKLTTEQVKRIRKLASNNVGIRKIANHFGLKFSSIKDVVDRRIWKHVK